MERPYPAIEFECEVSPGKSIVLPPAVASKFRPGQHVTVRITEGVVRGSLRARGVTEDLIERVAAMQLEDREHVIKFFEAERSLAGSKSFRRRAGRLVRVKR